nr:hypothetical protein [Tanacetum cinerariifolium]
RFLQVVIDNQVDDMTSHNIRYTSPALTHKVFANMRRVGKGFARVETPLFAFMMVPKLPQAEEEVEVPIAPTPSPPTLHDPTPTPHATPLQDPTPIPHIHHHRNNQLQPLNLLWGKTEAFDADKDITLVDVEKDEEVVAMDAKHQGRLTQEDVNIASKGVSDAEPTVFDDEEVTMKMAQTLIKLKAEKAKLLNEQIAQKLHDEEVQKATARDKQEKDDKEENID